MCKVPLIPTTVRAHVQWLAFFWQCVCPSYFREVALILGCPLEPPMPGFYPRMLVSLVWSVGPLRNLNGKQGENHFRSCFKTRCAGTILFWSVNKHDPMDTLLTLTLCEDGHTPWCHPETPRSTHQGSNNRSRTPNQSRQNRHLVSEFQACDRTTVKVIQNGILILFYD